MNDAESDKYFYSRPFSSRLGAWASNQSEVIENREVLEKHLEELKEKYQDREVPRPFSLGWNSSYTNRNRILARAIEPSS